LTRKCQRTRLSNLGEEAIAAVEGDTPRIVSKNFRDGKPHASAKNDRAKRV